VLWCVPDAKMPLAALLEGETILPRFQPSCASWGTLWHKMPIANEIVSLSGIPKLPGAIWHGPPPKDK